MYEVIFKIENSKTKVTEMRFKTNGFNQDEAVRLALNEFNKVKTRKYSRYKNAIARLYDVRVL